MATQHTSLEPFVACIGVDWADRKHDFTLAVADSDHVESGIVEHKPEALQEWLLDVHQRFPGPIAIAVEVSRGPLISALLKYDFITIFPIPPARMASYRKAFSSSGAKDDHHDSQLILDYLVKHPEQLRPWKPDDPQTRELAMLTQTRRKFVDQQTAFANSLTSALKQYFPQALEWLSDIRRPLACDFLERWTTLESLQRAKPGTIREFLYVHRSRRAGRIDAIIEQVATAVPLTTDTAIINAMSLEVRTLAAQLKALAKSIRQIKERINSLFAAHDDAFIFESFPGAAEALAPRLLTTMGTDRTRWAEAESIQTFSGIAPVTISSGRSSTVRRRFASPIFTKQTFHEFAGMSIRYCLWARVYYDQQRQRGAQHQAAVRALAYKWIRIIVRCWHDRTAYDDNRYIEALRRARSPLVKLIDARREELTESANTAS